MTQIPTDNTGGAGMSGQNAYKPNNIAEFFFADD